MFDAATETPRFYRPTDIQHELTGMVDSGDEAATRFGVRLDHEYHQLGL